MGGAEDAADALELLVGGVGDVLAEHAHPFVVRHRLVERAADRLAEVDRRPVLAAFGRFRQLRQLPESRRRARGIGFGGAQGRLTGRRDERADLVTDGDRLFGVEEAGPGQLLAQASHRVVAVILGDLGGTAVLGLVVRRRVRAQPDDVGVDEHRAGSVTSPPIASAPTARAVK